MSNLPAAGCTCSFDVDSSQGKFTQAVIKITLIILGLWVTSAVMPLYKRVYKSLMKGHSTCDVSLLVSDSLELYIKLGTLPGYRLDYVFSATEKLVIPNVPGVFSCKVTLNVPLKATDCSSGCIKMFEREIRTDPIMNYLFMRLQRDGLAKYQVV